jgi:hypothetical protein
VRALAAVERGRFIHLTGPAGLVYYPVCAKRASGHSGQPPSGDPPFTREASRIPIEVLRDFVREQALARKLRHLSKDWGLSAEALRKFALGMTRQPHPRQLQLFGTKFLELHPSGYVREKPVDGHARGLEQLKMVLPPGRENAQEVVERVFELAARSGDEVPENVEKLREWILKVLNAEYDAEARFTTGRTGSRRRTE